MGNNNNGLQNRSPSSHSFTSRISDRFGVLGFALAPILYIIALAGIAGTVLFTGYTQILRSNVEITADNNVRNQIRMATEIIAAQSAVNNALNLLVPPEVVAWNTLDAARLPRNSSGGVLTDTIVRGAAATAEVGGLASTGGIRQMDPWGRYFVMCRWEGSTGGGQTDPSMSILSAGADGNLATTCADTQPAAGSDDKIEYMTVANVLSRSANWQAQNMAGNRTGYTFGIDPDSSVLAVGVDAASVDTSRSLDIGGDGRFRGDLLVNQTLGVDGATTLGSTLGVTGATTLSNTLGVTGATTLSNTLNVTGATTLAALQATTTQVATLTASGATTLNGTATLNGATTIDDTLNVTGLSTLGSATITTATIGTGNITTGNITTGNVGALTVTGASALNTFSAASGAVSGALTVGTLNATTVNGTTGTFTNLTVTNPINGSVTGSAGSVDGGSITGIVPLNRGGTGVNASSNANLRTLLSIQTQDADLQALSDNTATGFIRRTGAGTISTSAILQSEVPAFTGASAGVASTLGGVPVAAAGQQNFVLTGNGIWTNPAALVGVTELIEGDSGVYVDDTGTGVIRFLIDGFEQARITGTASADRSIRLTGGTAGTVPEISAYSTGPNSSLRLSAIGTGSLIFRAGGADRLTIADGGSISAGGSITATGGFIGNLTGNASTATLLQTARNFSLTGDATASAVSFNGGANVALATTVTRLQGRTLAATAPNTDDAIVWNGAAWAPASLADTLDGDTIGGATGVVVRLQNGAVATPSLTFASDTNLGLYRDAEDRLGIALGATARMLLGPSGYHFNSSTDTIPLSVGRGVSIADEVIRFGVADGSTNIVYTNDEAQSYINFRMINTDTESGGGASASDNTVMRILSNVNGGRVGINTVGAPAAAMQVVSAFPLEQIRISTNETNNTNKSSQITSNHYLNAEEPFQMIGSDTTSTTNVLYLGGGFSNSNAATAISFRTAANNTTTIGTERMSINSAGTVGVVGNMTVGGNLTVSGTVTGSGGTGAGGSNTQVQFNSSNLLAGSANFTWNNGTNTLSATNITATDQNISGATSYGATTRQMINLWNTSYGIGIQSNTLYDRTATNFAWHVGGVHSNTALDAGAGGTNVMSLNTSALTVNVPVSVNTGADGVIIGTTNTEGFRIRREESFFAANNDAMVIEKTDGNGAVDGGIAFTNRDNAGVVTPTMVIRGNGNVGIGLLDPGAFKLNVNGNTNITGNLTVSGTVTGTGGTSAAGSDTHVQYNNGGVLGGISALTFNKSASVPSLGVIGSSTAELRLQGAGGAYRINVDNGSNLLRIFDNGGTARLSINSAGTVAVNNDLTVGANETISGTTSYGSTVRQMINLYSTSYGLGVQSSTHYARTGGNFAWFLGGVHSNTALDPGAGGTKLMSLNSNSLTLDVPTVYGPGATSTYGAITIDGAKGGWGGINFKSGGTNLKTLMITATNSGIYNNTDNGWDWYFNNGTLTAGTVPAARVSAGSFGTGNYTITGNLTVTGTISGTIGITFPINQWVSSTDGHNRFYFSNTGITYIRGNGGIEFRNGSDGNIFRVDNGGAVTTPSTITANGNRMYIVGTSPSIELNDTDNGGTRFLHVNSNNIGFLTLDGNWGIRVDDSKQFFAHIMYDMNNTAFYVDPASVSILNDIRPSIIYDRDNTGYYADLNGNTRLANLYPDAIYDPSDSNYRIDINGTSQFNLAYVVDLRPQIIYDWNNTSYRIDMNGTSVLNELYVDGNWVRVRGSNGIYFQDYGGGWHMQDTTYLRAYGNKYVLAAGYYHTSDGRLKHDVRPFRASGLDTVAGLRAVHFKWNADNREELGVIAQETEKVLPEAVNTDDKGFKQVQYDKLVLPVIEAVKELHSMVKDLVAKVADLLTWKDATDKRIQQLEDRLNKVEAEKDALARENAALKNGIEQRLKALEAK